MAALGHSKSLWNYTLSPGWKEQEVEVFRLCLMKFGLGKWTSIINSGTLPGKTAGQLNNQLQRMIGQQATNEFQGLHVDPRNVFAYNSPREGVRKNGCLVNTGDNPTKEGIRKKRLENQAKWGLTPEEIEAIVIPKLNTEETSLETSVKKHFMTEDARKAKLERLALLEVHLAQLRKRAKVADDEGEVIVVEGAVESL